MAGGHVTSTSSSLVVGQSVQAQVSLDLAPPIPREENRDEMTVSGTPYNVNTQQYLQVNGLTATASIELAQRGTKTSAFWNFIYDIHPTQQLFTGNQGSRFFIHVIDYLSGFDMRVVEIEWGWDPATSQGLVEVYSITGKVGEYRQTGFIPSPKQFQIQHWGGAFYVAYDGSFIASILEETSWVGPYKIKYGYYKLGGQPQSVAWPSGHPAFGGGFSNFIFNEAQLVGAAQWPPHEPEWTAIALNSSDVQIGTTVYNPTSVAESGNIPFANFTVPAVAGIAKFRIRAKFHNLNSSTLGWPYLDIPVGAGGSTPLAVSGPNPVTLEPGQTYSVTANYPTSELTFAAVGGGSFGTGASANVYTAPLDHGTSATYHFNVTRAAETVSIGVNVPLRMTPNIVSMIGGTTQVFTTNGDVTSWSSLGGSLAGSAARSRTYTAPTFVGSFTIQATSTTSGAVAGATATVTSSGTTPTTGLRLEPASGYSVSLNATPVVRFIGDIEPARWASVNNFGIDGATGNLIIQSNTAYSESTVAQCIEAVNGAVDSVFEWSMHSTMQATDGDLPQYIWELQAGTETARAFRMAIAFNYIGIGESWEIRTTSISGAGGSSGGAAIPFTRTNTSGIRVEIHTTALGTTGTVKFRASSADSYVVVSTQDWTAANAPRFLVAKYTPQVSSRPSFSITFQKPTMVSGFGRWYQPNWTASRIDGAGNILGSYPVTPGEELTMTSGNRAQTAVITCNAVGTCRVRATYPSGTAAQNDVLITITSSGTALAVTTPAAGVTPDLNPGQLFAVEANDSPAALTYSSGAGSFGLPGTAKNVLTAGATAGVYTLTVSRGSEVVTRGVRVLMRVTPVSSSLPFSGTVFLDVNTTQAISYSATGGTVGLISVSGGVTRLLYTAPNVAGNYTVNVTSSINSAAATVQVIASGTTPIVISNAEPITVEPNAEVAIITNYPASEVEYSATGGIFVVRNSNLWRAPTLANNYTITVSHPIGGIDTAIAFVPVRIAQTTVPVVPPGTQIQFTVNHDAPTWQISSASGGTISSTGLWTAGNTPGSYTITARCLIGALFHTDARTVTIAGSGLALNVPSTVTLLPGATLTITANVPTGELSFSATGGTFAGNVYTAPSDAGSYDITVTHGTNTARVVVTVPVVIAPATITLGLSTVQVFTVNSNVSNFATTGWTSTDGTLASKAVRTVSYTSGTTAGNFTVTAITLLGTVVAQITNTGSASVPIAITGPATITIEPNSTITVTTNKPVGTYSLTATGGTFEGNVYHAPVAAGEYIITATDTSGSGAGADTLTVTVPTRITPQNPVILPGAQQQFSVNTPSGAVSWSATAGSITQGGLWTAPASPGTYTITAALAVGSVSTQATVQSIELVVYGPDHITLESGQTYTVLANLPTQTLSYTANGGSFSGNVYTAPATAGEYWFEVSFQGQSKRVNVTVPVRISPDEVRLEAGQSFQFTINSPSAVWSVTGGGTITQTGFYTAPASGGTVAHVTATTPSGSDSATVLFLDEFPYQPNYTVESELNRTIVVVEAEDGTRFGRSKGPVRRSYSLKFQNRDKGEVLAAQAFWAARYPERPFLWNDIKLDIFTPVVFDSAIRTEVNGTCLFAYSFRIIEV